MHAVFALPCTRNTTKMSCTGDEGWAVDWYKAVMLAQRLADKAVPLDARGFRCGYLLNVYALFKWKTKKQSHFAQYTYWPHPLDPPKYRCVHLFTSSFHWNAVQNEFPCPYQQFPKFQGLKLREDGTPDVTFWMPQWHWKAPMDPALYTTIEWATIINWEKANFYYDHALKICTAKYDYLNQWVTETRTGRSGIVRNIGAPNRGIENWSLLPGTPIYGPTKKQWMKSLPLIFTVRMANQQEFKTTRRSIVFSDPEVFITYD